MMQQVDTLIIGSSPLLLVHAHEQAEAGRKVVVVDRDDALGGSWQTINVHGLGAVEIGCHLIEAYPGVYELLHDRFGVEFTPSASPPIRVLGERQLPYHSPLITLASLAKILLGAVGNAVRAAIGHRAALDGLARARAKSRDVWLQLRGLARGIRVHDPVGGYAVFTERLIDMCRQQGVIFDKFDVTALAYENGIWQATNEAGQQIDAQYVLCTSSANLRQNTATRFTAYQTQPVVYMSVVASAAKADAPTPHSYVAFSGDNWLKRAAWLYGISHERQVFLIELHRHPRTSEHQAMQQDLQRSMNRAGLIKDHAKLEIHEILSKETTNNLEQMRVGVLAPQFYVCASYGNLASGLVAHIESQREWEQNKNHAVL